nr:PREDICTED: WD repeat-containing protein KIAA1875-like isoform X1 [Lepisosteus oculatus]XP_015209790.1 PREDICTED: WD repeat-containing protein KIAA1875-like isoform X1 [Lepisosteus oculatus]
MLTTQTPVRREAETPRERVLRRWGLLRQAVQNVEDKVKLRDDQPCVLTHGLQHLRYVPCSVPVIHMGGGREAEGFVSLDKGGSVWLYHPDGQLRATLQMSNSFVGITGTGLPDCYAAWGPQASLALLDRDLRPLVVADSPPDICTCQSAEGVLELVTAGAGNVSVWCVRHLVCRAQITEGFGEQDIFTQLALTPYNSSKTHGCPHRAFAVSRTAVAVIDLCEGRLLEYRSDLHLRNITGVAYCLPLDGLATASWDGVIRVWGPDWGLQIVFVGHTGAVTALACCSQSSQLLSSSLDGTLRCWSLEQGDEVQTIWAEGGVPVGLGGLRGGGSTFISYSEQGVNFWRLTSLYRLHCQLCGEGGGRVQKIVAPSCPPSYPTRALCLVGDRRFILVAGETGEVLTTFCLRKGQRAIGAEYCLPLETLMVLTEEGTVIRVSMLTSPACCLGVWQCKTEEPWPGGKEEAVEAKAPTCPGPARCLLVYSHITDPERALMHWRSLQENRGEKPKRKREGTQRDDKNRFLVVLGQERGFVTVLSWMTGKVQYRTPAHNGHTVTVLQASPATSQLISIGEDRCVLVWRVFPYAQECLNLHISLFCGQPPLHCTTLGPLLALAFQEPDSATYSLTQFNLLTQQRTDHPPSQDPVDSITGLCACPRLKVFASSSKDGTIQIWDDENQLLRTLCLSAEPESLAFCGERGDLLLGIQGNLFRIDCASLLPRQYKLQLLCDDLPEPILDPPIPPALAESDTTSDADRTAIHRLVSQTLEDGKEGKLHSSELQNKEEDYLALVARDRDLALLQQGAIESKRRPQRSRETQKEAFAHYLQLLYRDPPRVKVPEDELFDLQAQMCPKAITALLPIPDTQRGGFFPDPALAKPWVHRSLTSEQVQWSSPTPRGLWGSIPNSVLVGQLWPPEQLDNSQKEKTWRGPTLRDSLTQCIEEDDDEARTLCYDDDDDDDDEDKDELDIAALLDKVTINPPKEKTPPPPVEDKGISTEPAPRPPPVLKPLRPMKPPPPIPTPTPPQPPPRQPSVTLPSYLLQFLDQHWFQTLFPDPQQLFSPSHSAGEFVRQLLHCLKRSDFALKIGILRAILTLHQQGALQDSKEISVALLDTVRQDSNILMTPNEREFLSEALCALVSLCPSSTELAVELITHVAQGEPGIRRTLLPLLERLGLEDQEGSLITELDSWDIQQQGVQVPRAQFRDIASQWLQSWTCKYKMEHRQVFLTQERPALSPIDVLNFFCSVQRESLCSSLPPPPGRKDTVLLQPHRHKSQAILRLGETHSLARTRTTQGLALPPLPNRSMLMGFVPFITLPLPRVSLCPFPCPADKLSLQSGARRYFILEQSYVHNYK